MGTPDSYFLAVCNRKTMTKSEVLAIFERSGGFLSPDEVRAQLRPPPDRRSLYSYLLRLAQQGLLEAYRLTDRGRLRLRYFQGQPR